MQKQDHTQELIILGKRIQQFRRESGLTQEDVADAMGCSVTYISKLERGRASCNLSRLLTLANVLQCDAAELLFGVNRGSRDYLYPEISQSVGELSPSSRELVWQVMTLIESRTEEGNDEHAVP